MFDKKTVEIILEKKKQNISKEEIYQQLIAAGFKVDGLNEAYAMADETGGTVEVKEEAQKRTIRVMVLVGAILVGAGIFSFIAANWQAMDRVLKVSVILVAMLASYGLGWLLTEVKGYAKTGGALFLLGCLVYGGGIFLVAQMFNVRENWPDGFILWMLGTLAMAFALGSFWLFVLALPVGLVAIVGFPADIFSYLFHDKHLMTSIVLLVSATLSTAYAGFRLRSKMPDDFKGYY